MRRMLLGAEGSEADPWYSEDCVLEQREWFLRPGPEILLGSEAVPSSNTVKFSAMLFEQ